MTSKEIVQKMQELRKTDEYLNSVLDNIAEGMAKMTADYLESGMTEEDAIRESRADAIFYAEKMLHFANNAKIIVKGTQDETTTTH